MENLIDVARHPLGTAAYRDECRARLARDGVLVLHGFLTPAALQALRSEGRDHQHKAYYTAGDHNVYLAPDDDALPADHPRNRRVVSSKGCITTDQIPTGSPLSALHGSEAFREFLCDVLDEPALHDYADPLSSINLHYASAGQELGWHFDNSSFAITLLVQKPTDGGVFEYVRDARDSHAGDMNHAGVGRILDGVDPVDTLSIEEGSLVLFRGRDALHRVTPTEGDVTRMLAVLAYNAEPGVALSESARMTFYGRLG